jgi:hypothetical protein
LTIDFSKFSIENDFHICFLHDFIDPDLFCLWFVFSDKDFDTFTQMSEIECFRKSRITPTDDDDISTTEKIPITSGTIRYARTEKSLFTRNIQMSVRIPCCIDQVITGIFFLPSSGN